MFSVPLKSVLKARRERTLGSLNPLPFTAQAANAAGWIGYTFVLAPKDLTAASLIFWPNQLGLLKTRDRQLAIILFFSFVLSLIGAVGVLTRMNQHELQNLWGFTANAILLMYYAAPLSTVWTVISTKSAATLHWPLALMQIINGCLWLGYGLAIEDPFVWVPNGIGACTGALLTTLVVIFREKKVRTSPVPSEDGANSTTELRTSRGLMSSDEEFGGGAAAKGEGEASIQAVMESGGGGGGMVGSDVLHTK